MRLSIMAAALAAFAAAPAMAADPDAPSYENGTVWQYTEVKTVDGHFDDYMGWLSTSWKAQEEALKQAGMIKSYKVLMATDPRENEGDLLLVVEYANMAALDRSVAEQYAIGKKLFGPLAKSNQEQAARGTIRTIKSNYLLREAVFK